MEEVGVAEVEYHTRQNRQAQADAQDPAHRTQFLALAYILGVDVNVMVVVIDCCHYSLLFRSMVRRDRPAIFQFPDDAFDLRHDRRGLCIAQPGVQNLQPFGIVEAAIPHDITRQAVKPRRTNFDVFKQLFLCHGHV